MFSKLRCAAAVCALVLICRAAVGAEVDVTWLTDGVGNWNAAANWDLGVVPNNGADTYNVLIDGGDAANDVVVTLNISATINDLSIDQGDSLMMANGTLLGLVGDGANAVIDNRGLLRLTSSGSATTLSATVLNTVLTGGGQVQLTAALTRMAGVGSWRNVDNSIFGAGALGMNSAGIVNESGGTIHANVPGSSLIVDPSSGAGLANAGVLRASIGGTLILSGSGGGAFVNSATGVVRAEAGSIVQLENATVSGGLLQTVDDGLIRTAVSSNVFLTDLTIEGRLDVQNNSDLGIDGTIHNTGLLNVTTTGNQTDVEIQADATLTGGGRLVLAHTLTGINGTGTLTNVDHTIEGAGNIGRGVIGIVNEAESTMSANLPGEALVIHPSAAFGAVNRGALRAENGGRLVLSGAGGGGFDNTDGEVTAAGADSIVELQSASISSGTLNGVSSGLVRTSISSNVLLTDVTINGNLHVQNNSDLGVDGEIVNTGEIRLLTTGNQTDLEIQDSATLTGGGKLALTHNLTGLNGLGVLTHTNHTIEGVGNLGRNVIGIANLEGGFIDANVNGETLVIDPSNAFGMVNQSEMRATNGGVLVLRGVGGGGFNNQGGVIAALAGSAVVLDNAVVSGGRLLSDGTGAVRTTVSSNVFLKDLEFSGALSVMNNSDLGIDGTIVNTGVISLTTSGNQTDLEIQDGATLTGGGRLTLTHALTGINGLGVLTHSNHTIEGAGNIGRDVIGLVNEANGLVHANIAGETLTVDPIVAFGVVNRGVMQASGGGILLLSGLDGGAFDNADGVIQAFAGSAVQLNSATVSGGVLRSVDSGVVRTPASANVFLSDLTLQGRLEVQNLSDLGIDGTITNEGTIEVLTAGSQTDVEVQADATLSGPGRVVLTHSLTGINGTGTLTNRGGHTIEGVGNVGRNVIGIANLSDGVLHANVDGGSLIVDPSNAGGLVNRGLMKASGGGTLTLTGSGSGAFSNEDGGVVNVASTVALVSGATLVNLPGGLVNGGGTLNAAAGTFRNEGVVAPGESLGVLTIVNDFTQTAFGTLKIELNGTEPGVGHDQLVVSDAAALAGTLEVTLLGDFLPVYGDEITIVRHVSRTGTFNDVQLPDIGGSTPLRLFYSPFRETLAVIIDGDTNGDGRVNLDDLNDVRNNFGITALNVVGDTNYDDTVDLDDLNNVRNFFGTSIPVPEPSAAILAAAGSALAVALRRHARRN